jgi:hypothetical protein
MPKQPEADYEIDWDDAPLPKLEPPLPKLAPPPEPDPDRELAVVQARAAQAGGGKVAEGTVTDSGKVELLGKHFRVAEKIGLMPLLKFASASSMTTEDPRALAAVYSMLQDCIYAGTPGCGTCKFCTAGDETACKSYDRGDWDAFEQHAMETKADGDELLTVITQVLEIVAGRPTKQPGGSSSGPRTTRRASTGSSSGGRARASKR